MLNIVSPHLIEGKLGLQNVVYEVEDDEAVVDELDEVRVLWSWASYIFLCVPISLYVDHELLKILGIERYDMSLNEFLLGILQLHLYLLIVLGPSTHLFFLRCKALHNILVHLLRNNIHELLIVGLFNDAVGENKPFYPLNFAGASDLFEHSLNELILSGIKHSSRLGLFVTVVDVDVNLVIYVVIDVNVDVYVLFVLGLQRSEVSKCQISHFFSCHHLVGFVYVALCHRFIHLR